MRFVVIILFGINDLSSFSRWWSAWQTSCPLSGPSCSKPCRFRPLRGSRASSGPCCWGSWQRLPFCFRRAPSPRRFSPPSGYSSASNQRADNMTFYVACRRGPRLGWNRGGIQTEEPLAPAKQSGASSARPLRWEGSPRQVRRALAGPLQWDGRVCRSQARGSFAASRNPVFSETG